MDQDDEVVNHHQCTCSKLPQARPRDTGQFSSHIVLLVEFSPAHFELEAYVIALYLERELRRYEKSRVQTAANI